MVFHALVVWETVVRPPPCPSTTAGASGSDTRREAPKGLLDTGTFNVLFKGFKVNRDDKIYDIVKEYPDMYAITAFKSPMKRYHEKSRVIENQDKTVQRIEDNLQRSVRRSKLMIRDYALSNDFNLFCTFTFNPRKVNRYDLGVCYLRMQGWLHRQSRKYEDFGYVIVPERHKDGAIHFHALFMNFGGSLKKTNVIQNGRRVYNISGFTFGFTNVQYTDDDRAKTAAYLSKYITKDMELISNRRRYWSSKNLRVPSKHYNKIYDFGMHRLIDDKTMVFENDYMHVYEVPKSLTALFD